MTSITQRKDDHLDQALHGDVGFRHKTTLMECVEFVHEALPELSLAEVDLRTELLGKPLRAPLVIAAMTGGTDRARRVNRALAELAEQRGYGFGLGSQRVMLEDPAQTSTYCVREVAPTALVLANIGAVQARQLTDARLEQLVTSVGADALCLHLNPAQELAQPGGDRDFRGVLSRLEELARGFLVPIVVKETGCGLARATGERLRAAGVRHVDVSGAGGTSWVAVEMRRASSPPGGTDESFAEWGIPTAASVGLLATLGFETLIATGGISDGLTAAKAFRLGAHAVGIARPVLVALESGGREAAGELLLRLELELRRTMLLVGAARVGDLRRAPCVIRGELREWLAQS